MPTTQRKKEATMVKEMIKHQAYLDTGYHAKGRIKRMRTKGLKGMGFLMFKYDMLRFCQRNIETPNLTRWNRH